MILIGIGAVLIILGVVVAASNTAKRGRLSDARPEPMEAAPDTLEPRGKGARLSFVSDVPGIALVGLGAILLLMGSFL